MPTPTGKAESMATRTYRGVAIFDISSLELRVRGYRYSVETRHVPTGILYAEESRPKTRTLEEAREIIRERLQ